jgi:hypothetical protein
LDCTLSAAAAASWPARLRRTVRPAVVMGSLLLTEAAAGMRGGGDKEQGIFWA